MGDRFASFLLVLVTAEALTCSWVGTSAGRVKEVAQEGISAGMAERGMALGTLEEDKARDTLWVGTQEEAGRAACTAALGKTSCRRLRI